MARRNCQMSYKTRSMLRESYANPTQKAHEFVPAIAVRRPVIMEAGAAKDLRRSMKRALKRELPRRQMRGCEILPPEDWSVTILERGKLISELRSIEAIPSSQDMWRLSGLLRRILLQQLGMVSSTLELPLGDPDLFGNGKPKSVIGVPPLGWRGRRAHYAERDEMGQPLALGTLVAENSLCIDVLTKQLPLNEEAAGETLSRTPHLAVVRNRNGFRPHELRAITPVVRAVMPNVVMLGDPVIYLHADRGSRQPYEISLRPRASLNRAAAA